MTRRHVGPIAIILALGALVWFFVDDRAPADDPTPSVEDQRRAVAGPGLRASGARANDHVRRAATDGVAAAGDPPAAPDEDAKPALVVETVDAISGRAVESYGGLAGDLGVRPPPGYVFDGPAPGLAAPLAAGIERATYVMPLWREAVLDLRVLDPEGQPARDVKVFRLYAAGRTRRATTDVLVPGELRIRGIPHMPGEPVRAVLDWGSSDALQEEVAEEEVGTDDLLKDAHVVTTIPDDAGAHWEVEVRLKDARGPAFFSIGTDNDLPWEESFGLSDLPKHEPASLRVRVLDRDGKPMRDAQIGAAQAGADGVITLADLYPGPRSLAVKAPGRFTIRHSVTLAPGETRALTVREPVGARLEVLVTDPEGRPRPSAHIAIPWRVVFDVVDGVQRLDMFTDVRGRRTFARVEPGDAQVVATWGSRQGTERATLRDGETTRLTIIAR